MNITMQRLWYFIIKNKSKKVTDCLVFRYARLNTFIFLVFNAVSRKDFIKTSDNAFKGSVHPFYQSVVSSHTNSLAQILIYLTLTFVHPLPEQQTWKELCFSVILLTAFNNEVLKMKQLHVLSETMSWSLRIIHRPQWNYFLQRK